MRGKKSLSDEFFAVLAAAGATGHLQQAVAVSLREFEAVAVEAADSNDHLDESAKEIAGSLAAMTRKRRIKPPRMRSMGSWKLRRPRRQRESFLIFAMKWGNFDAVNY